MPPTVIPGTVCHTGHEKEIPHDTARTPHRSPCPAPPKEAGPQTGNVRLRG